MGPWRCALRSPSGSPGWTRTSNPSINSRMLCQLSYRGKVTAGGLYGATLAASRRSGGAAPHFFKGFFKGSYFFAERLFRVVVVGLALGMAAAQDHESQPELMYRGRGRVETVSAYPRRFGIEDHEEVHQGTGPLVGEDGAHVRPRVLFEHGEDPSLVLVAEIFGQQHQGLWERGHPYSLSQGFRAVFGAGEDRRQRFAPGLLKRVPNARWAPRVLGGRPLRAGRRLDGRAAPLRPQYLLAHPQGFGGKTDGLPVEDGVVDPLDEVPDLRQCPRPFGGVGAPRPLRFTAEDVLEEGHRLRLQHGPELLRGVLQQPVRRVRREPQYA